MAPHSWLLHVVFVSIFHLGQIDARQVLVNFKTIEIFYFAQTKCF